MPRARGRRQVKGSRYKAKAPSPAAETSEPEPEPNSEPSRKRPRTHAHAVVASGTGAGTESSRYKHGHDSPPREGGKLRRAACLYFWNLKGRPGQETDPDTIKFIKGQMLIEGRAEWVGRSLTSFRRQIAAGRGPTAEREPGRPRGGKLTLGGARVFMDALCHGSGRAQATTQVNLQRASRGKGAVCRRTCVEYCKSLGLQIRKRQKTKTGGRGRNSLWAGPRLKLVQQLKAQLTQRPAAGRRGLAKLDLNNIFWCDEHHNKVSLGRADEFEYRSPRGADGEFLPGALGGEYGGWHDRVVAKYTNEARGCYGVGVPLKWDAAQSKHVAVAARSDIFWYTGCMVLGPAAFEAKIRAGIYRVRAMVGGVSSTTSGKSIGEIEALEGGRYEAKYGAAWRSTIKEVLSRGGNSVRDVRDMMDWAVAQGNAMFGNNIWAIYHDASSAWFSAGAITYLALKLCPGDEAAGRDRIIMCREEWSPDYGTYKDRLPGDGPEMMPLDMSLFGGVNIALDHHVAVTPHLAKEDPRRFSAATPKGLMDSLEKIWPLVPTAARIVQDCNRWPVALDEIEKAGGAHVPDMNFRSGRRAGAARRGGVPVKSILHANAQEVRGALQGKWASWYL